MKFLNSKRYLNLQEYQSKQLLQENGVNVQRFEMANTPDEAYKAGKKLSKFNQLN